MPYPPPRREGQDGGIGRGKGLILAGIAVVVVLALVAVVFGLTWIFGGEEEQAGGGAGGENQRVEVDTSGVPDHAKPVLEYLVNLSNGDVAAIKAMGFATVPSTSDSDALLNDDVLANAPERVSDPAIADAGSDFGGSAYVKATYRIGERSFSSQFPTQEVDGEWKLASDDMNTLRLSTGANRTLVVNGVEVAVPDGESQIVLAALPGSYEVKGKESQYLTSETATVLVGDGYYDSNADVEATPTELALNETQKAVDTWVAACAADPSSSTDCPFYSGASATWKVTTNPTVRLGTYYDGRWRLETARPGQAEYSRSQSGYDYTGNQAVNVYGYVTISDDKVTFEPL